MTLFRVKACSVEIYKPTASSSTNDTSRQGVTNMLGSLVPWLSQTSAGAAWERGCQSLIGKWNGPVNAANS